MARLVNDIVARLYLNNDWRDISSDVRAAQGVTIQRGRKSEDGRTPPQTCSFTLDNTSGDYTERDPLGLWYGYLGRNTPLEMSLRLAKDTATTNVSNGWGSMDTDSDGAWTAYAWSTSGGSASDYNKASGKATHLISTAPNSRLSYLADFDQRDLDITVTFSLNVSDITGGTVATDIIFRAQSAFSTYYVVRVLINTDESVTVDLQDQGGNSLLGGSRVVAGITHSSSQALKIRGQVEGQTLRAKVWVATAQEPYTWDVEITDRALINPVITNAGMVAIRSVVGAGNTNVPLTFSYDDIEIRVPVYFGEVSEWPQTRDVSGTNKTVEVEAGGVLRRLQLGRSPLLSAPRRAIPDSPGCTYYWPLEDGPLSTIAKPVVGDVNLLSLALALGVRSATVFGNGELAPWLPNGALVQQEVLGTDAYALNQPSFTAANGWCVEYFRQARDIDDATDSFYVSDNADGLWLLTINHTLSTNNVLLQTPYGTTTVTNLDLSSGEGAWIRLEVSGSGTVSWKVKMNGSEVLSSSASGSAQAVRQIVFTGGPRGLAIGQIAIYHDVTSYGVLPPYPMLGNTGERASDRFVRLCLENSVSPSYIGSPSIESSLSAKMGPQGVKTLPALLEECADADGGLLYEERASNSLVLRQLESMYGRSSWCSLSLANRELSTPWKPVPDDRFLRNKVTLTREYGGSYTHSVNTGRLSTLPPEQGGVGIVDDSETLSLFGESQLVEQAAWRTHLGTVDEERYPAVVVELHRDQIFTDNPTLYARLLDLDVGDQITLADLVATGIYDDTDQLVLGYERFLSRFNHKLTLNCAPASPYQIAVPDDADVLLGSGSSTLASSISSSAGSFSVATSNHLDLWTTDPAHFPLDVRIGGEVIRISAISGTSSPQTFTVDTGGRAINGVVKGHSSGAEVHVETTHYIGL